jgi:Uma2 family endonuclease
MTILSLPSRESWTVDDLDDLPRELRCEVHDGILVFKQPVTGWHTRVQYRLMSVLLAAGRYATFEVGVINGPRDTRIADVAVFHGDMRDEDLELAYFPPERIFAVVEVVSPSSRTKDGDPRWYADRGIQEYWLVERVPEDAYDALVTMHELTSDGYVEFRRTTLGELMRNGYQ